MPFDPCYDHPCTLIQLSRSADVHNKKGLKGSLVMKPRMAKIVTEVCNELPFVSWDRFIDCDGTVVVFGWIDREKDSYKDFVTIEVSNQGYIEFTTSSAKYSEVISDIYISHGRLIPGMHQPCQRIEDDERLAGIKNLIRIRDK